ncbi:MAG: helix-turn-helix domain-containing protein [Rhodobacter sp.]|nr:helix-turn-helix domain-containing protein [Rhodobacter sp.]
MAKRVLIRALKRHRHYTYDEAADALGVTVQTVRSWRAQGLPVMTEKRPHLMLGEDLAAFHKRRNKPPNKPAKDRFRCFRCRDNTRPLDGIVFYTSLTPKRGQLEAVCGVCGNPCFRFASEAGLADLSTIFEIVRNGPSQA